MRNFILIAFLLATTALVSCKRTEIVTEDSPVEVQQKYMICIIDVKDANIKGNTGIVIFIAGGSGVFLHEINDYDETVKMSIKDKNNEIIYSKEGGLTDFAAG